MRTWYNGILASGPLFVRCIVSQQLLVLGTLKYEPRSTPRGFLSTLSLIHPLTQPWLPKSSSPRLVSPSSSNSPTSRFAGRNASRLCRRLCPRKTMRRGYRTAASPSTVTGHSRRRRLQRRSTPPSTTTSPRARRSTFALPLRGSMPPCPAHCCLNRDSSN